MFNDVKVICKIEINNNNKLFFVVFWGLRGRGLEN